MWGLPVVEQAPINWRTFGCGFLFNSLKIFNSLKKSDLSVAVAPSGNDKKHNYQLINFIREDTIASKPVFYILVVSKLN